MATEDDGATETTFTRAQMAKMVNAQVKEKLAAALADYGDLEELKAKAAEADKQKTSIDKMAEQVAALTKRAETAEIDSARARVADKLGLTSKEAKRLSGKTYDELLADGEELVEDLGIDTAARKRGEKSRKRTDDAGEKADDAGEQGGDDEGDDEGDDGEQDRQEERRAAPRRRPQELRSGARMSSRDARDERDPLKLIEDVPRVR
jgi:hypothetical protein